MGITVRGVRYALSTSPSTPTSQDRGGMAHDMAIYLSIAPTTAAWRSCPCCCRLTAKPTLRCRRCGTTCRSIVGAFVPDTVLDLPALLPAEPGHFLYTGSLPMPPCTEDVLWVVMKHQ